MSPSLIDPVAVPAARGRAAFARWAPRRSRRFTLFVRPGVLFAWASDGLAEPDRASDFDAWTADHPKCRVNIVLGGALTRQLCVADPASPLDEPATLAAWAGQQFATYHGSAALAWPIQPWLLPGQRGACALHGLDLEEHLRLAKRQSVRLLTVEPWWSVALRTAELLQPSITGSAQWAMALIEGKLLTWSVCVRGRVIDFAQRRLVDPTTAALCAVLAELAAAVQPELPVCVVGYGLVDSGPWPRQILVPERLDTDSPPSGWVRA